MHLAHQQGRLVHIAESVESSSMDIFRYDLSRVLTAYLSSL
jgi:hypothetical protein